MSRPGTNRSIYDPSMNWNDGLNFVTTLATVLAVGFLYWEVRYLREDARTSFEDDLSREYRAIVALLPVEAFFIDGPLPSEADMRAFYCYFDLSNQQLFLGRKKRVSPATLEEWKDGIAGNMQLPAFAAAWEELVNHLPRNFFEELRDLCDDLPGD